MRKWDPLNSAQHELLKRVGAGADLSAAADLPYRQSAYALSNRGLVTVSKRGGVFRASITDAGRFRLEHGHHPDRPEPAPRQQPTAGRRTASVPRPGAAPKPLAQPESSRLSGPTAPTGARIRGATPAAARDLVDRVKAAGGTLRIEDPDAETRAALRRTINLAKRAGLVPKGHHLRHTGRDSGTLVIQLAEDAHPDETSWNRERLSRSRVITEVGAVVAAMRNDPTKYPVSEEVLPRALEVLRLVADEAQERGHRLSVPRKRKHPTPILNVNNYQCELVFVEEKDKVPHVSTAEERRRQRRFSWERLPEFDHVPSGRLRLEARADAYTTTPAHQWADTKRHPLEKQVGTLFNDLEAAAEAKHQAHLAWLKKHEEWLERQRREDQARQAGWEEAMRKARKKATVAHRREAFGNALEAWHTAMEIRALCNAFEERAAHCTESDRSDTLRQWIAWGRRQADRLDPTSESGLECTPFDFEPGPDDLRPHLGDWSPYKAEREYRSQPTPRPAVEDAPTENWFARRRSQWWRR
ncbi:hypothetical protein [Embleya sp. NPDC050493]|uniref:hypothetical protein n=1 Tax=Embleya sp. NPDC050493 TaxID=3363989 RepID=UPI0037BD02B2